MYLVVLFFWAFLTTCFPFNAIEPAEAATVISLVGETFTTAKSFVVQSHDVLTVSDCVFQKGYIALSGQSDSIHENVTITFTNTKMQDAASSISLRLMNFNLRNSRIVLDSITSAGNIVFSNTELNQTQLHLDDSSTASLSFSSCRFATSSVSIRNTYIAKQLQVMRSPSDGSVFLVQQSQVGPHTYPSTDRNSRQAFNFYSSPLTHTNMTIQDTTVGGNRDGFTFRTDSPLREGSTLSIFGSTLRGGCIPHQTDRQCKGQFTPAFEVYLDGGQLNWGSDSRVWNYGFVQIKSITPLDGFVLNMSRPSQAAKIYFYAPTCTDCNIAFQNIDGYPASGVPVYNIFTPSAWIRSSVLLDGLNMPSATLRLGSSSYNQTLEKSTLSIANSVLKSVDIDAVHWKYTNDSKLSLSATTLTASFIVTASSAITNGRIEFTKGCVFDGVSFSHGELVDTNILFRDSVVVTTLRFSSTVLINSTLFFDGSEVGNKLYPNTDHHSREAIFFYKTPVMGSNITFVNSTVGGNRHGLYFRGDSPLLKGSWISVHNSTLKGGCVPHQQDRVCRGSFTSALEVYLDGGHLDWGSDSRVWNFGIMRIRSIPPLDGFVLNMSRPSQAVQVFLLASSCTECNVVFRNIHGLTELATYSSLSISPQTWTRSSLLLEGLRMPKATFRLTSRSQNLTLEGGSNIAITNSVIGDIDVDASEWRFCEGSNVIVKNSTVASSFYVTASTIIDGVIEVCDGSSFDTLYLTAQMTNSTLTIRDSTVTSIFRVANSPLINSTLLMEGSRVGTRLYSPDEQHSVEAMYFYKSPVQRSTIKILDSVVGGNHNAIQFRGDSPLQCGSVLAIHNSTLQGGCIPHNEGKCKGYFSVSLDVFLDGGHLDWRNDSRVWNYAGLNIRSNRPLNGFVFNMSRPSQASSVTFYTPSCTDCRIAIRNLSGHPTFTAYVTLSCPTWIRSNLLFEGLKMPVATLRFGSSTKNFTMQESTIAVANSMVKEVSVNVKEWRFSSGQSVFALRGTAASSVSIAGVEAVDGVLEVSNGCVIGILSFQKIHVDNTTMIFRDSAIITMWRWTNVQLTNSTLLIERSRIGTRLYLNTETGQSYSFYFHNSAISGTNISLVDSFVGGNRHGFYITTPVEEGSTLSIVNSTLQGGCIVNSKGQCSSYGEALYVTLQGARLFWKESRIATLGGVSIRSRTPLTNFRFELSNTSEVSKFVFSAPSCEGCLIRLQDVAMRREGYGLISISSNSWVNSLTELQNITTGGRIDVGVPSGSRNTSTMAVENSSFSFSKCWSGHSTNLYLPTKSGALNSTQLGGKAQVVHSTVVAFGQLAQQSRSEWSPVPVPFIPLLLDWSHFIVHINQPRNWSEVGGSEDECLPVVYQPSPPPPPPQTPQPIRDDQSPPTPTMTTVRRQDEYNTRTPSESETVAFALKKTASLTVSPSTSFDALRKTATVSVPPRSTTTTVLVTPAPSPLEPPTVSTPNPIPQPTPRPQTLSPAVIEVQKAVEPQKKAVETTASTVVLTSAVSSSGGSGGAAQDLQALFVLGGMSCANTAMNSVASGGDSTVAPLNLGRDGATGVLFGNAVLISGVSALQAVPALMWCRLRGRRVRDGFSRFRFPSWTFTVFALLYQGTTLAGFTSLFDSDTTMTDRIVGAIAILFSTGIPAIGPVMLLQRWWRPKFIRYRHVFKNTPKMVKGTLLPKGYYESRKAIDTQRIVTRFNTLFSSLRCGVHPLLLLLPFGRALLISFIAALPGSSPTCAVRFGMAGFIYFASAVLSIVYRPHRIAAENLFSCLSNLLIAAICATGATESTGSLDTKLATLLLACSMLSMVWMVYGVIIKLAEFLRWKKAERRLRTSVNLDEKDISNDSGGEGCSTSSSSESSSTSDDEEEMEATTSVDDRSVDEEHNVRSHIAQLVVPLNPLHCDGEEGNDDEHNAAGSTSVDE